MDRSLALFLGGAITLWFLTRPGRLDYEQAIVRCDGEWILVDSAGEPVWQCRDSDTGQIVTVAYTEPPAEAVAAAKAALSAFDHKLSVIMTAIAGAESRWDPDAAGDRRWGQWSCNGYQSWGLWQIRIPVWKDLLIRMGAPSTPCGMAQWLRNPINNAKAAKAILDRQGFDAWSAYKSGAWMQFVPHALGAVVKALSGGQLA